MIEPLPTGGAREKMAGFTLLEVLVALIIFAIAFGALADLFQTTLRQTATADDLRRATALAETQLARIGRDLALTPGEAEGLSADGLLRWKTDISLARPIDESKRVALYHIRVDTGPATEAPDLVSLTTLRLGYR